MKHLMLFVHPNKDFIREHKTSVKIEIDNNLSLGWKRENIILATNFPYEHRGVKSILVSSECYNAEISPCASIIFVIAHLFEKKLIQKGELYWYHDTDLYQLCEVTESEVDLGKADMGVVEWPDKEAKISASSFFFKSTARDIFYSIREIMIKYRIDEEVAMKKLLADSEDVRKRVKKLNITYDFEPGYLNQFYQSVTKPIKTAHFHFTRDRLLDSAMYGKNSIRKPLMPQRLIKIFHKHGVKGTYLKKMKNLMIYMSPEEKFPSEVENLVKKQIDNSLEFGWKEEDVVLITNFPYEYKKVKSIVLDDISKASVISYLLSQEVVKDAELWWYHDLDVFQHVPMDSSQIDLEDRLAGFLDDGVNKFDLGSIFFRKESDKIFEWMRNRTQKFGGNEVAAIASLVAENYRNINSKYVKFDGKKMAEIFDKR